MAATVPWAASRLNSPHRCREEETEDELAASSKKAAQTVVGGITGLQVRVAPMHGGQAFAHVNVSAQAPVDPWSLRAYTCKPKPHRYTDDRWKAIRSASDRKRASLGVEDFQVIRRIGRGDVGSVHLVRLKGTNVLYAMKVLEKAEMVERNKLHRVRTEDTILSAVDHPFVATLFTSFQTSTSLHFVMEVRTAARFRARSTALSRPRP